LRCLLKDFFQLYAELEQSTKRLLVKDAEVTEIPGNFIQGQIPAPTDFPEKFPARKTA
jgi:hypothetical protein